MTAGSPRLWMDKAPKLSWPGIALRIIVVLIGGYAAAAGFVATVAALLSLGGLERAEAVVFASMLGFPVYLGFLLWGCAELRLSRVCVVLGLFAGGGVVTGLLAQAWLLAGG